MAETEYTYEDLKHKNVDELREIAGGLEGDEVQGVSQMNKEHVLEAICKVLHIDMHVHHEVVGINKKAIKDKIQELKKQRDAALEAHNHEDLKKVRRKIHHLKRRIHKAMV